MCKGKAQNRIDYIVLQKPTEAAKIVEKYGYEPPKKVEELVKAVKLLVKKKGEPIIKDLIAIHPERKLILEVTGHKSDESNYCGCHSSYSGETKELLDQLSELSVNDLTQLYEDTKKKSKEKPEDKTLMAEVETVWDELKRRKKQTEKLEKKSEESTQSLWLKFGLFFLAGVVIAKIS
ncbi:MAG: hypothetical protein Q7W45_14645 [Bacteroidota bacterium]|jgi:hypothetical protein|nr:hypothetical protein [Bacteroidota bacterium]MDP3147394.1 hypothetical protein [Bacteroidota bacterium]